MSTTGDVHVGDVGTHYKAELQDAGAAFPEAADATIKKLYFQTRSGVVVRDAEITTEGTGAAQKWFLNYTVVEEDVDEGLHAAAGQYSWQGFVKFADGQRYSTNVETYVVAKNLYDPV